MFGPLETNINASIAEAAKINQMNLGAIDDANGEYCRPVNASKDRMYSCVDCQQRVILRKGEVRKPHFAHCSKRECSYYEHPNESQIHKDAKFRMAEILKQKEPFSIYWSCNNSKCRGSSSSELDMIYKEGDEVVIEYRDPLGKYVADVAVINSGKPRMIFEIKNTHATTTPRPEPWFEFEARELFEQADYIYFTCVRRSSMRECLGCKAMKEEWINNVPRMKPYVESRTRNWKQETPCVICKRSQYSPIYFKGYRSLCKICLESDYDELKKMYDLKGRCLFV
jgi:hypothetical protein